METAQMESTVGDAMDSLVNRATASDIPPALAREVAAITLRALALQPSWSVSCRDKSRLEAYFSEVVRRRTVRGAAGSRAVARLVAAAVVDDLRRTGRDGLAVFDQLRRGWSEQLPADVLEEYRVRLCG